MLITRWMRRRRQSTDRQTKQQQNAVSSFLLCYAPRPLHVEPDRKTSSRERGRSVAWGLLTKSKRWAVKATSRGALTSTQSGVAATLLSKSRQMGEVGGLSTGRRGSATVLHHVQAAIQLERLCSEGFPLPSFFLFFFLFFGSVYHRWHAFFTQVLRLRLRAHMWDELGC